MTITPNPAEGITWGTDPTAAAVRHALHTDPLAGLAAERRYEIAQAVRTERLAAALPRVAEPAPSSALRRAIAGMLLSAAHRIAADVQDPFADCYGSSALHS